MSTPDPHAKTAPLPSRFELARAFARVAPQYESRSVVAELAGDEMLDRLDVVSQKPDMIVDLGAGTGRVTRGLARRYPEANIYAVDLSADMLAQWPTQSSSWWSRITGGHRASPSRTHRVLAHASHLPFADASVNLVIANMSLPFCDAPRVMTEVRRVLADDGLLMFTTVGPDTLKELDHAWREVGVENRVTRFPDMHDLGDLMIEAGFADPVMDMDMLTLTHRQLPDLWADLRAAGSRNLHVDRPVGLTSPRQFCLFKQALQATSDAQGLIHTTVELVYGHAWAAATRRRTRSGPGNGPLEVVFQGEKKAD